LLLSIFHHPILKKGDIANQLAHNNILIFYTPE